MSTPKFVFDGVLHASMRTPENPAIVFGDETITYGELAWRMCRVASGVDVRRAQRVAVSLPNHPALLEIFLGATLAGAVLVLFEPKWPRATLDQVIAAHQPQLIIGEDQAANVKLAAYAQWRDQQDPNRTLLAQPTPRMPFLVGFTSGTTGTPKAFIRSHESWTRSFAASKIEFGTSNKTKVLLPGPLSHGLSLYAAVETLNAGGAVYIQPAFDAQRMMTIARAGQVNVLVAAPTLLDLIHEAVGGEPAPAITRIITAGAKLSPALRDNLTHVFPNGEIIEYYGASELSFVTVAKPGEGCPPESVGRAFNGVQLKVTPDDAEAGMVWVKSDMIAAGYVGEKDGSGFRVQDGWATVGDRGRLDERGFLTLLGREDDMIITGGLNVYPAEVEAVVAAMPGVSEVAVLGEDDTRWGQVVTAVLALQPNAHLQMVQLKDHCTAHLTPHKLPRRWFAIDDFTHTASGKIDRTKVAALLRERSPRLKALA
ncbi:MAG: fatty-acyl-CoA synthase [Rhodospirillaceae bacterium]|nr:fatty-acyl-CoA synthase [Rhodospirillaceae bacterium]